MAKPAPSKSSLNPWEALLASATRARSPQDATTSASSSPITSSSSSDAFLGGGYTILLQHSMTPKSQRKWALESTIANVDTSNISTTNKASLSSQFASSLSIQKNHQHKQTSSSSASSRRAGGDWYGISGPFLVRQAFHDLSQKCNGRVVLVSVAGTSGICDYLDDQGCNDYDAYYDQSSTNYEKNIGDKIKLFRQNGACVDLNSNPFGWNDENDESNCNNSNDNSSFSIKATLNNLQSIANAIRQAASRIIETTEQQSQQQQQQQQQPIPIIFDSLTPLLHLHGAERITVLLKSLGKTFSSSPLDNKNISGDSTASLSCLSPIIAPILYESICLSDHRTLEDCADAMVHLNLMDSSTQPSANYAVEAKDDNSIAVTSGVMDLVRRGGGGGSNGLGGKLMRHCVPVHILRSLSTTGDLRDGCYWIIDNVDDDNTVRDGDVTEKKKGKKQMIATSSSTTDEMGQSQSTDTNLSRPKIYLEDDDPDFQDYDEDDDLDL